MVTQVVGSKLSTFASDQLKEDKSGYGQNGYGGASSDHPGQKTTSGFLPQSDLMTAETDRKKFQERTLSGKNVPIAYCQKGAAPGPKIGPAPVRPAEPKM